MKKIYLIGKDINYSKSPLLQNAMLKELGHFDIEYEIKNLEEDQIEDFLKEIETNDDILGANVTTPYKNVVGNLSGLKSSTNIIFKRDGKLKFSSTDFIAAFEAVSEKIVDIKFCKVFLLGNGGVSDSIVWRFRDLMSTANDVSVFGRTPKNTYYKEYTFDKIPLHASIQKNKQILFINCTPIGMNENESLFPKECLKENDVVFDMVYSPHETKMIKDAKEVGCEVVYGIDMLMYNSIFSLELFLNQSLDIPKMKEFLKKILDNSI